MADLLLHDTQMQHFRLIATLVTATLSLASRSHADSFTFSYSLDGTASSYFDGTPLTVSGFFTGDLNGNLISNISNATLTVNGTSLGPVFSPGYSFDPAAQYGALDGAAVVSLDGTENNFFFINSDLAHGDLNATGYFYSFTGAAAASYLSDFGQSGGLWDNLTALESNGPGAGSPLNASWTVTDVSKVPDQGPGLALLGSLLLGLAAYRRRFAA